jgi:hypothetical protein
MSPNSEGSRSVHQTGTLKSMSAKQVRTDPPSEQANNSDVFVWALFLLGGADKTIEVEEVCLKCFEIAPARFGWRTHPELPEGVKGLKALSVAENKSHQGLIYRPSKFTCRLTPEGVKWVETYRNILERIYAQTVVQASKSTNLYERKRHEIKKSGVWNVYIQEPETLDVVDFASVLQCSAASSQTTWTSRVNELKRAADVLNDEELMNFAKLVESKVLNGDQTT